MQYVDVVAGGAVWVSEPAGQGLDAELHHLRRHHARRARLVQRDRDEHRRGLRRRARSSSSPGRQHAVVPQASPPIPASCVLRIDQHGAMSDAVGVGAAVTLLGPGPAVVVSDTTTGQFDLVRLS